VRSVSPKIQEKATSWLCSCSSTLPWHECVCSAFVSTDWWPCWQCSASAQLRQRRGAALKTILYSSAGMWK